MPEKMGFIFSALSTMKASGRAFTGLEGGGDTASQFLLQSCSHHRTVALLQSLACPPQPLAFADNDGVHSSSPPT